MHCNHKMPGFMSALHSQMRERALENWNEEMRREREREEIRKERKAQKREDRDRKALIGLIQAFKAKKRIKAIRRKRSRSK